MTKSAVSSDGYDVGKIDKIDLLAAVDAKIERESLHYFGRFPVSPSSQEISSVPFSSSAFPDSLLIQHRLSRCRASSSSRALCARLETQLKQALFLEHQIELDLLPTNSQDM